MAYTLFPTLIEFELPKEAVLLNIVFTFMIAKSISEFDHTILPL